jgi:type III restriction enzyme
LETLLTSKLNELYSQEQKELIEAIKSMGKESFLKNSYMKKQAESLQIDTTNLFENISKEDFKKNYGVELRNIEKHYYNPILISKDNNKYKHIIKEESEIEFLDNLEKYISNNILENIDWWYFSKIDEIVDNIFIPYFDSEKQEYRNFYPDFIFWLKKDKEYYIKFIDLKGLKYQTNPKDKIKGYENIFENNFKIFETNKVNTNLYFYNKKNSDDELLEKYRFFDIKKVFE